MVAFRLGLDRLLGLYAGAAAKFVDSNHAPLELDRVLPLANPKGQEEGIDFTYPSDRL